jgi:hypothetical protein
MKDTKLSVERIKDYLTISAIGIVMIGIANEASALQQTFGAAAHGFVLLSSFMFSIGLYYSAISISQDSSLRRLIRKSTVQLLDNMGTQSDDRRLFLCIGLKNDYEKEKKGLAG